MSPPIRYGKVGQGRAEGRGLRVDVSEGAPPAAPVPTISTLTPNTISQWEGATTVVVAGTNFSGNTRAYLDGIELATTYNSPTQVTATVPATSLRTARTGIFKVTNIDSGQTSADAWLVVSYFGVETPATPTGDWEANLTHIVLNGTKVQRWLNAGFAGSYFENTTASAQPTHIVNDPDFNNYPSVDFIPANLTSLFTPSGVVSSLYQASARTELFVMRFRTITANNATQYLNGPAPYGQAPAYTGCYAKTPNQIIGYTYDTGARTPIVTIGTPPQTVCMVQRHGNGTQGLRIGLGAETTVAAANAANITGYLSMGVTPSSSNYLDGKVARVLVYNVSLSNQNIERLVRMMSHRYALGLV